MIAFLRVASIKPGKTGAAMMFAKEITTFIKAGHGLELEVLTPIGGNPQRVAWSTRYTDLAALETAMKKLTADAKYWELVNSGADCFIAGSMRDEIWQTL